MSWVDMGCHMGWVGCLRLRAEFRSTSAVWDQLGPHVALPIYALCSYRFLTLYVGWHQIGTGTGIGKISSGMFVCIRIYRK